MHSFQAFASLIYALLRFTNETGSDFCVDITGTRAVTFFEEHRERRFPDITEAIAVTRSQPVRFKASKVHRPEPSAITPNSHGCSEKLHNFGHHLEQSSHDFVIRKPSMWIFLGILSTCQCYSSLSSMYLRFSECRQNFNRLMPKLSKEPPEVSDGKRTKRQASTFPEAAVIL